MSKELATNEKFEALTEEIAAVFTEHVFAAREEVIKAHHETGQLLAEYSKQNKVKITLLVESIAATSKLKKTTLWLSHQFYQKYPDFNEVEKLGYGKNVSWNKIRKLIAPKVKEETIEESKERTVSFEVSRQTWQAVRNTEVVSGSTITIQAHDAKIILTIKE